MFSTGSVGIKGKEVLKVKYFQKMRVQLLEWASGR